MKVSLIIFMISLLGVAMVTPYFMKRMHSSNGGGQIYSAPVNAISSSDTRQTFYKWKDSNGNWQFGDTVPEGANAVPVEVDTAANILAPVKVVKPVEPELEAASEPKGIMDSLPFITPDRAAEAFDQAEKVKALMENRVQQLDAYEAK